MLVALLSTISATTSLSAAIAVEADIFDYELPGHPNTEGYGHVGWLFAPALLARYGSLFELELGAVVRVPMSLDFEEELGARPIAALRVHAHEGVLLTFGSLPRAHGLHPALFDDDRQRYARDIELFYNLTIPSDARRDLGGDPFMAGSQGARIDADAGILKGAAFLDWQLLETEKHREKFAFGARTLLDLGRASLGGQIYVTHYGGQRFTEIDPLRFAGRDPKRQPITLAAIARGRPLEIGEISADLIGAVIAGHMIQTPGGSAKWHWGGEIGAEIRAFDAVRAGYRVWLPKGGGPGFLGEDGDPIYREGRAHRFTIGLTQRFDDLSIDGRLDLVQPEDSSTLQYEAVTIVSWRFEREVWRE